MDVTPRALAVQSAPTASRLPDKRIRYSIIVGICNECCWNFDESTHYTQLHSTSNFNERTNGQYAKQSATNSQTSANHVSLSNDI